MKTPEQILKEIIDYCKEQALEIQKLENELYDEVNDQYNELDEGRLLGMKNVMSGLAKIII